MTETTRQNAIRSLAVPLILIAACGASAGASALVKRLQKQEYMVQTTVMDTANDTGWQPDRSYTGVMERRVTRGINSNVVEYRIDSNGDGIADLYKRVACGHDAYAKYSCTTTETKMPTK